MAPDRWRRIPTSRIRYVSKSVRVPHRRGISPRAIRRKPLTRHTREGALRGTRGRWLVVRLRRVEVQRLDALGLADVLQDLTEAELDDCYEPWIACVYSKEHLGERFGHDVRDVSA